MLAEETRDMRSRRRQRVVQGRRDDHLDDRLAAPSERSRVAKGAIHVSETGRQDDSRRVMIRRRAAGSRRKARKLGEGDVHPESTGAATPRMHAAKKGRIQRARRNERRVKAL